MGGVEQTPHKETGSDQSDQRQCHLHHHEDRAGVPAAGGCSLPATLLQVRGKILARCAEAGDETKENSGGERQPHGVSEDVRIQIQGEPRMPESGGANGPEDIAGPSGNTKPTAPPATERITLSTSNWRINCQRVAPRARRTVISRPRPAALAS